jgi:hypothetical protein
VKQFATVRIAEAATKYGEQAPLATTCCNACRTCVTANFLAIASGLVAASAGSVARRVRDSAGADHSGAATAGRQTLTATTQPPLTLSRAGGKQLGKDSEPDGRPPAHNYFLF